MGRQAKREVSPSILSEIAELAWGGNTNPTGGRPDHWHSHWQIVAITRGVGWVRVGGATHSTPAGTLFVIPPEIVHSNDVFEGGIDYCSMLVSPQMIDEITISAGIRPLRNQIRQLPVIDSAILFKKFLSLHRQTQRSAPSKDSMGAEVDMSDFIQGFFEYLTHQMVEPPKNRQAHPGASRAREFLRYHTSDPVSLDDLAAVSGLSKFETCRQFKTAFGISPHAWHLQARVNEAREKMRAGETISTTALDLGFADQAHFSRIFKRTTGFTPGIYRKNFCKKR